MNSYRIGTIKATDQPQKFSIPLCPHTDDANCLLFKPCFGCEQCNNNTYFLTDDKKCNQCMPKKTSSACLSFAEECFYDVINNKKTEFTKCERCVNGTIYNHHTNECTPGQGFEYEIKIVQPNKTSTNAIGFAELVVYDKYGPIDLDKAIAKQSSTVRHGGCCRTQEA
eukprot:Pgem_evm1s8560